MQPFRTVTGIVAPLDRANVDTDQIVPKQFLKRVERTGFGEFLFYDWRYAPDGSPRPEFVLNRPEYRGATILVAGPNFGCGSSREHAVWALKDFGFRAILAPSFADIFHGNCLNNGVLPVRLPQPVIAQVMVRASCGPGVPPVSEASGPGGGPRGTGVPPVSGASGAGGDHGRDARATRGHAGTRAGGYRITVDLETQTVSDSEGLSVSFDVDPGLRHRLLNGLDEIAVTLSSSKGDIAAYETTRPTWLPRAGT